MDMFDAKKKPVKLKASDIRTAMRAQWGEREWAIMWEVREGTGYSPGRSADAVMMSLWPSRGLELHGVEIKVSRSDWKREAADPTKAEAIAKYCDRWWVHTPTGIVQDLSELPPMWGLREFDGKKWSTVREAEKTETAPIDRPFLAALLRRSDNLLTKMITEAKESARRETEDERARIREHYQRDVEGAVNRRVEKYEGLQAQVSKFEEAFGSKIQNWSPDMTAIGKAAAKLAECNSGFRAESLAARLRAAAEALEEIAELSGKDNAP